MPNLTDQSFELCSTHQKTVNRLVSTSKQYSSNKSQKLECLGATAGSCRSTWGSRFTPLKGMQRKDQSNHQDTSGNMFNGEQFLNGDKFHKATHLQREF